MCSSVIMSVCVCVCVCECMHVQMAVPLMGACVWVSCNSRGWIEEQLSGSQGRVHWLLQTEEWGYNSLSIATAKPDMQPQL